MIEHIPGGFLQKYDHPYIQEIRFFSSGICRILFRNGTEKEYAFQFNAVYLEQFGAPLSADGKTLFLSDWDKGLMAYDTDTGALRWRFKSTRIAKTIVYPTFVLAEKRYESLILFDIKTGEVLNQIKSGTIEGLYKLTEKEVLVDSFRGKVSVVDSATLKIIKSFSKKEINPSDCLSLTFTDVRFADGDIVFCGFESCMHRNYLDNRIVHFQRSLPAPFLSVSGWYEQPTHSTGEAEQPVS